MNAVSHHAHDAEHATEGHCRFCGGPVDPTEDMACGPYECRNAAYRPASAMRSWMVPDEEGHQPKPGAPKPPPPPQEPKPGKSFDKPGVAW